MKTSLSGLLVAVLLGLTAGFAGAQHCAKIPRIGYLNNHAGRPAITENLGKTSGSLVTLRQISILYFTSARHLNLTISRQSLANRKVDVIVTANPDVASVRSERDENDGHRDVSYLAVNSCEARRQCYRD
jgi:hypothetical protein